MIYNPDTIDVQKLKDIDESLFLKCQIKYRESFESILKQYVSFNQFDEKLEKMGVPVLSDFSYNFYHKYSTLGSKYLFFRNNFHLENLSEEEWQEMKLLLFESKSFPLSFLQKTFLKVLFEEGEHIFVNSVNLENSVFAKSFIFEFAYDLMDCKEVSQIKEIEKSIHDVFENLKTIFSKKTNIPVSFVIYTGIPDLFLKK